MADKDRDQGVSWEDIFWEPHKYNERRKLKDGLFLRSYCPHCKCDLISDGMIHLEVTGPNDETSWIKLSPHLNVFERKTDIRLAAGQNVKDLRCPQCHSSLVVESKGCGFCGSRVSAILVGVSNVRVPFLICMREGCHWHAISPADQTDIILDDSEEW